MRRLARAVCDETSTPDRPALLVAGVLGPTNRTASLSPDVNDPGFRNITFDELRDTYCESVLALVRGGADIILIETVFDTLNARRLFLRRKRRSMKLGERLPIWISGTITDLSGPHVDRPDRRGVLAFDPPRKAICGRVELRAGRK